MQPNGGLDDAQVHIGAAAFALIGAAPASAFHNPTNTLPGGGDICDLLSVLPHCETSLPGGPIDPAPENEIDPAPESEDQQDIRDRIIDRLEDLFEEDSFELEDVFDLFR